MLHDAHGSARSRSEGLSGGRSSSMAWAIPVGLFLLGTDGDESSNPRLRKQRRHCTHAHIVRIHRIATGLNRERNRLAQWTARVFADSVPSSRPPGSPRERPTRQV